MKNIVDVLTYEARARSLIARLGGKAQIIKLICSVVDQAIDNYGLVGLYDGFMGGNRLFSNLEYNPHIEFRVASEIDLGLVQFFLHLQDPYKTDQLIDHIWLTADTITTKEQFEDANTRRVDEKDPMTDLERASLTYIISKYSMAADMQNFSQGNANRGIDPATLEKFLHQEEWLSGVELVAGNYLDTWKKFIHRDDFLTWLDPPYLTDAKKSKRKKKDEKEVEATRGYIHPFTPEDQEILIDHAIGSNNKIIISGYKNVAYKRLEANGFKPYFIGVVKVSSSSKGKKAKEYIWANFPIDTSDLPTEPDESEIE